MANAAASATPEHLVVIIGAGPGGICASILLQDQGIEDFVILDQAADFRGSWRDNHHPGLAVDVPGFTYQYTFAPNPEVAADVPDGSGGLGVPPHCRAPARALRARAGTPGWSRRNGMTRRASGGCTSPTGRRSLRGS